jgi:hypothetical protein
MVCQSIDGSFPQKKASKDAVIGYIIPSKDFNAAKVASELRAARYGALVLDCGYNHPRPGGPLNIPGFTDAK